MSENTPPKGVVQYADALQDIIGIEPSIEPLKDALWRVTMQNARVILTIDLQGPQGEWTDSSLTVDGRARPWAIDARHAAEFFHDTDATLARSDIEIVVPEAIDPTEAPPIVQHQLAILRSRAKKADIDVHLSRTENGGWCLGVYFDEETCIEIYFSRVNKRWTQDRRVPFRLIIRNYDISHWFDNVEQALKALFNVQGPVTGGQPVIGHPRGVQGKANSVRVRNTTVIRN